VSLLAGPGAEIATARTYESIISFHDVFSADDAERATDPTLFKNETRFE
jgi:hypothetical protein